MKLSGDWKANVGMKVAPPPPGPIFCQPEASTGWSGFVVLHESRNVKSKASEEVILIDELVN
jgi:hypothetical protein